MARRRKRGVKASASKAARPRPPPPLPTPQESLFCDRADRALRMQAAEDAPQTQTWLQWLQWILGSLKSLFCNRRLAPLEDRCVDLQAWSFEEELEAWKKHWRQVEEEDTRKMQERAKAFAQEVAGGLQKYVRAGRGTVDSAAMEGAMKRLEAAEKRTAAIDVSELRRMQAAEEAIDRQVQASMEEAAEEFAAAWRRIRDAITDSAKDIADLLSATVELHDSLKGKVGQAQAHTNHLQAGMSRLERAVSHTSDRLTQLCPGEQTPS